MQDNWVEICIVDALKTHHAVIKNPKPRTYSERSEHRYVGDIDHMDVVLIFWLGVAGPLDRESAKLIGDRHSRNKPRPWRVLAKKYKCSRETLRLRYKESLLILMEWVPRQNHYDPTRIARICNEFIGF